MHLEVYVLHLIARASDKQIGLTSEIFYVIRSQGIGDKTATDQNTGHYEMIIIT